MNHTHRCPCGTELRCAQPADACIVASVNWTCDNCLQVQRDDYLSRMIAIDQAYFDSFINPTPQEPNRHES